MIMTILMLINSGIASGNGIEQSKVSSYVTRLPPGVDVIQTLIHMLR